MLRSRRGTQMGPAFPEIVVGTAQLPDKSALDGELIVWDWEQGAAQCAWDGPTARKPGP